MLLGKLNGASPISNISSRDVDCMRQSVRIDGNVALNPGYLLASIVALFTGSIRILDALRVNDAKACVRRTTMADADLAN